MTAVLYPQLGEWGFGVRHDTHCRPLVRRLLVGPIVITWWSAAPAPLPPEGRRARRVVRLQQLGALVLGVLAVLSLAGVWRAG